MNTLPPAELPHLQLGFIPLLDCVLLVVARERGIFTDQGLEMTLSRMVDALQQGRIDDFCVGESWGSLATLRECYSAVHFDHALHH